MSLQDGRSEQHNGHAPRPDGLSFEEWQSLFLADAEHLGILKTAKIIGDTALRLFWEQGVAPTVDALLMSAQGSDPAA